jgi:MFS superfamily sulfate permease-like transporter
MRTAPAWIVLQCAVVTDIDVIAAEVLKALEGELNDRGVHLAFVEPCDRLRDLVHRYGLSTTLDRKHFYPASPRPLMRSTMRPWTALCRPMKGCRLHEHRP